MPYPNISDEDITRAFARNEKLIFFGKNFNYIQWRYCGFEDMTYEGSPVFLPLTRVLSLAGITPQMLRPVAVEGAKALGDVQPPERIDPYEQLGRFRIDSVGAFRTLAKVLGKTVEVFKYVDSDGNLYSPTFTVRSSGEVVRT